MILLIAYSYKTHVVDEYNLKMFICLEVRTNSRTAVPFRGIELKDEITVSQLMTKIQNREFGKKFMV